MASSTNVPDVTSASDMMDVNEPTSDVSDLTDTLQSLAVEARVLKETKPYDHGDTKEKRMLWASTRRRSLLIRLLVYDTAHLYRMVTSHPSPGHAVALRDLENLRWGPNPTTGTRFWGMIAPLVLLVPGVINAYDISSGTLKLTLRFLNDRYLNAWLRLMAWSSPLIDDPLDWPFLEATRPCTDTMSGGFDARQIFYFPQPRHDLTLFCLGDLVMAEVTHAREFTAPDKWSTSFHLEGLTFIAEYPPESE